MDHLTYSQTVSVPVSRFAEVAMPHDSPDRETYPLSGSDQASALVPVQQVLDRAVNHHSNGDLTVALTLYGEVLSREPDNVTALNLSGLAAHQGGDHEGAATRIARAIEIDPDYSDAHSNLGLVLSELGHHGEAVDSHRRALALEPGAADILCNLGTALQKNGDLEEAASAFGQALEREPGAADIHCNRANVLHELGRYEEAVAGYERALAIAPNFADALGYLGSSLLELKQYQKAVTCFERALTLRPGHGDTVKALARVFAVVNDAGSSPQDRDAVLNVERRLPVTELVLSKSLSRTVPRWHVPMMNDTPRNDAYFAALKAALKPEDHLLEIGTGSGLLAMMAAQLGVRKVTTCEAVPLIAETAKGIVADNGLDGVVTVVGKMSTDLVMGQDIDTPADVLVSEVLSSEFVSEGVLSSIEDAKRRLLRPGAAIIPRAGSMMIGLLGGRDIADNIRVGDVNGFDLSRFNTIASAKMAVYRNDLDLDLLSEDTAAFTFDFVAQDSFPAEEKLLQIPVTSAGVCQGVIQWNHLQMDESIVFENHPSQPSPASAWNHIVYAFDEAVEVVPGQTVVVAARHDRNIPWFSFVRLEDN